MAALVATCRTSVRAVAQHWPKPTSARGKREALSFEALLFQEVYSVQECPDHSTCRFLRWRAAMGSGQLCHAGHVADHD